MVRIGTSACHSYCFRTVQALRPATGESLFYLLYMRDPRLPTEAILCPPPSSPFLMDSDDYIMELTRRMSQARKLAGDAIKRPKSNKSSSMIFWSVPQPLKKNSYSRGGELFGNPISGSAPCNPNSSGFESGP